MQLEFELLKDFPDESDKVMEKEKKKMGRLTDSGK